MKNRQLMRLNKVLHKGEVKTVDCISPGYVSFIEDNPDENSFGHWVDLDEVEFIPLTEEWLLKLGFIKDKTEISIYYNNDIKIQLPNYFVWKESVLNKLKHVHQLQNLYFALYFALYGRELVIKDGI